MANELTLSGLSIAFSKANVPPTSVNVAGISVTVSGTQWMDNVQAVGTSEEAILMGDVAAGGYMLVQNMDATNFVSLRQATGAANFMKLLAGEFAIFRLSPDATAPFAIADTASVNVRFLRFDL